MQPLAAPRALIDQAYERLADAIASGALAPGSRLRQEQLAAMLGVSRQPVSHALRLLKREGLVEEREGRGLTVARLDPARLRDLYQVRTALDALAARLAAERLAQGAAGEAERRAAERALRAGRALAADDPAADYIEADVAFHMAIYRLSGNAAIAETVAAQWPHMRRSMAAVLGEAERRPAVWAEHARILELILAGDAEGAEAAARSHTTRAGEDTARRLAERAAA
jgi:DNA-binding GntR family transcriptional regulator